MDKTIKVDQYFQNRVKKISRNLSSRFKNKAILYNVKDALKERVMKVAQEYLEAQEK